MSVQQRIIAVVSIVAILGVAFVIVRSIGGGDGERRSAIVAVQSATPTEELIARRADLIEMIHEAIEDHATIPERLETVKRNLASLESQLRERGVDVDSLTPRASWQP